MLLLLLLPRNSRYVGVSVFFVYVCVCCRDNVECICVVQNRKLERRAAERSPAALASFTVNTYKMHAIEFLFRT